MINTLNSLMVRSGIGVLYLDEQINVVSGNELAFEMLQNKDGVWRNGKKLFFSDSTQRQHLLDRLSLIKHNDKTPSMFVKRESGKAPIRLSVYPFEDEWHASSTTPTTVLLMRDTARQVELSTESFAEHYSLTKAEIALTAALFKGQTLQEYSIARGVKITTVRWTLDNVFSKTYTKSQAELKSLALKFAD